MSEASQRTSTETQGAPTNDSNDLNDSNQPRLQTVTAVVDNKAGVLARVVGLFARRAFNITSLAVAPTNDERFSRITFVYDIGSAPVEQVINQVNKLINVIEIEAIDNERSIERELLMATVRNDSELRSAVNRFSAQIIDTTDDECTLTLTDTPQQLDAFEAELNEIGIVAMQRSGRLALHSAGSLMPA